MKKKVLFIIDSELCIAGVPTVVMNLVRNLHNKYVFDVITLSKKKGYYDEEFESFGGKVYRFSIIGYEGIKKLFYPVRFFQIYKQIKKHLRTEKYDIIHCHSGFDDGVCLFAGEKNKIPIKISHSHADYSCPRKNKILKWSNDVMKKFINKYSDIKVACSEKAGKSLFSGEAFHNILNPVDTEYYRKIQKCEHEGINLVQIGYFCTNKNQLFSVKLLKKLKEKGVNARLKLVGFEGEEHYLEALKEKIAELGIEEFVQFFAPDADKYEIFSTADYCLIPSENEGLSMVSLEAQSAGIPCLVSSNVPKDADIGAVCFLEYNNLELWSEKVIEGFDADFDRLNKNIGKISVECYLKKIDSLYRI